MRSIAERYCTHHEVPPEAFARHALLRSLTFPAQLAYPFLRLAPGFFAADLEFIRHVGRSTSLRDFAIDAADFQIHPDNTRPLRRLLKLRVSSRKLRRHLAATLMVKDSAAASAHTSQTSL